MSNPDETKADRFTRLSGQRLPRIIHSIELLGNLSRSEYEFTMAQAADLSKQLRAATDRVTAMFGHPAPTDPPPPPPPPPPQPTLFASTAVEARPPPPPIELEPLLGRTPTTGALDHDTVMWAYEMIKRGDAGEGQILLARALGIPQDNDPLG